MYLILVLGILENKASLPFLLVYYVRSCYEPTFSKVIDLSWRVFHVPLVPQQSKPLGQYLVSAQLIKCCIKFVYIPSYNAFRST